MKTKRFLITIGVLGLVQFQSAHSQPPRIAGLQVPLRLEANAGQMAAQALYAVRRNDGTMFLTRNGFVWSIIRKLPPAAASAEPKFEAVPVRMAFVKSNNAPVLTLPQPLAGRLSFLRPGKAKPVVAAHGNEVIHGNLYNGIDLVTRTKDGGVSYAFRIAPSANPSAIVMRYSGAEKLSLDVKGNLLVKTKAGVMTHRAPRAAGTLSGLPQFTIRLPARKVACKFKLLNATDVSFEVTGRRRGERLVIDPEITFGGFIGGSQQESAPDPFHKKMAVAPNRVFITARTFSPDFPGTNAPAPILPAPVVFCLDTTNPSAPAMVYATYLPAGNQTVISAIAVDSQNRLFLGGNTASNSFPTPGTPFQDASLFADNLVRGLVASLSPDGVLDRATFFSAVKPANVAGAMGYLIQSLALDEGAAGTAVWVVGEAGSSTNPNPNQFNGPHRTSVRPFGGGSHDAYVARLSGDLSQAHAFTFVGGSSFERFNSIALHGTEVVVGGHTVSANFPTTANAAQAVFQNGTGWVNGPQPGGHADATICRLDKATLNLTYATFLGGFTAEFMQDMVVTSSGRIDASISSGQGVTPTDTDCFLARIAPDGSLASQTRFGNTSTNFESPSGVALGRDDATWFSGTIAATGLATTDAPRQAPVGLADHFLTKIDAAANKVFFTYLGGTAGEIGFTTLASEPGGNIVWFQTFAGGGGYSGITTGQPPPTSTNADMVLLRIDDTPQPPPPPNVPFTLTHHCEPDYGFEAGFTVTVTNQEPQAVTGLRVDVGPLPPPWAFGTEFPEGFDADGVARRVIDSLAPGETRQVGFGTLNPPLGQQTVTARLFHNGNQIATTTDTINIIPKPPFTVTTALTGPADLLVGQAATFDLRVTNTGVQPVDHATVWHPSSFFLNLFALDPPTDPAVQFGAGSTDDRYWDVGVLTPGQTKTLLLPGVAGPAFGKNDIGMWTFDHCDITTNIAAVGSLRVARIAGNLQVTINEVNDGTATKFNFPVTSVGGTVTDVERLEAEVEFDYTGPADPNGQFFFKLAGGASHEVEIVDRTTAGGNHFRDKLSLFGSHALPLSFQLQTVIQGATPAHVRNLTIKINAVDVLDPQPANDQAARP